MPESTPVELSQNSEDDKEFSDIESAIPSDFKEPETNQKHAGGRPRSPLPTPRAYDLPPVEFFRYWWNLQRTRNFDQRVIVYPYRLWPIIDVTLGLPEAEREQVLKLKAQKRKSGGPPAHLGLDTTLKPFDPDNWEQEIYHRYGAGDYNFRLNDTEKGINKTICMCTVKGLRDSDRYPPNCLPNIVVISDPANKSYVEWARMRGIRFPGDPFVQQEKSAGEDMAETTQTLVTALVDATKNKSGSSSDTQTEMLKEMITGLREDLRAERERNEQRLKAISDKHDKEVAELKAAAQKPTGPDPMALVASVTEMAKSLIPKQQEQTQKQSDPIVELLREDLKAERERHREDLKAERERNTAQLAALEKRLESAETRAANPTSQATGGLGAVLKDLIGVKKVLDGIGGGNDSGNPLADMPGWAQAAVPLGEKLLDTVTKVSGDFAKMKSAAPMAAPQTNGTQQMQPPQAIPQGQPQQQITLTPQQQEQQNQMNMQKQFAAQIHPALMSSLRNQRPGYELAGQLIAQYGEMPYNFLLPLGVNGILGILQLNPELWGELLQYGNRLEQFITEFMEAAKARTIAQQLLSQQSNPMTTVPPQAPHQSHGGGATIHAAPPKEPATPKRRMVIGADGKGIVVEAPPSNGDASI